MKSYYFLLYCLLFLMFIILGHTLLQLSNCINLLQILEPAPDPKHLNADILWGNQWTTSMLVVFICKSINILNSCWLLAGGKSTFIIYPQKRICDVLLLSKLIKLNTCPNMHISWVSQLATCSYVYILILALQNNLALKHTGLTFYEAWKRLNRLFVLELTLVVMFRNAGSKCWKGY